MQNLALIVKRVQKISNYDFLMRSFCFKDEHTALKFCIKFNKVNEIFVQHVEACTSNILEPETIELRTQECKSTINESIVELYDLSGSVHPSDATSIMRWNADLLIEIAPQPKSLDDILDFYHEMILSYIDKIKELSGHRLTSVNPYAFIKACSC